MQTPDSQPSGSAKNGRSFALKMLLITIAVAWLSIVAASWADAAESQDEEYNFNWLDPEKKIYVLQNRRYSKAKHLMLSGMVGTGFSNPYRSTINFDPRIAYYFTESWGVEVFYTFTVNSQNSIYEALVAAAANTRPVIREINAQFGGLAHWSPWYAKINVFNKILYFDWYFTAGAGSLRTTLEKVVSGSVTKINQDLAALYLGTGHQYHLSNRFLVRLDFTGAFYRAPVFGDTGSESFYSNYNVGIGLGLKL